MNKDEYAIIIDCKYAQGILIDRLLQNNMYNNITKQQSQKMS